MLNSTGDMSPVLFLCVFLCEVRIDFNKKSSISHKTLDVLMKTTGVNIKKDLHLSRSLLKSNYIKLNRKPITTTAPIIIRIVLTMKLHLSHYFIYY